MFLLHAMPLVEQRYEEQDNSEPDDRDEDVEAKGLQSSPQRRSPTHGLEFASIYSVLTEVLFNPQQLVVLADAVGAAERAVLIWPALVATRCRQSSCLRSRPSDG